MVRAAPLVDPRGLRFAAAVTAVVLAAVLLTGSGWLLGFQAAVFGVGAFLALRWSPYSVVFRKLIAPRLGPPAHRESATPPRFAQGLGFAFATVGVIGYASGVGWLGFIATALAWVAAFLNAAFGFCLGCETYLLVRRILPIRSVARTDKGVTA
ncbi:MAG: DUF4395 domain-containing protein [Acidothermaceae bacterium]